MKKWFTNILLLTFSIGITLAVVEFGLRHVLFNQNPNWDFLRNPALYAIYHRDGVEDHFNEDYWKLNYLFNRHFNVTEPHPLLGWTGYFTKDTYEHADQAFVKGRRPVLLFGDSFAMCVDSVKCFQDYLNADTTFSKDHYFLNYGVGGYGLDQIHLLMKDAVPTHSNPLVVFSMLTTDMDRSMLYMRDSHKGRFELNDGELELTNTPITQTTEEFVSENPPEIRSYVINMIRNGITDVFGEKESLKWGYVKQLKAVNEALIRNSIEELRSSETEFVVLLFQSGNHNQIEWRHAFLRDLFDELKVPYISTADVIAEADHSDPQEKSQYTIIGDGHPTSFANGLVSAELLKYILQPEHRDSLDARNKWPKD